MVEAHFGVFKLNNILPLNKSRTIDYLEAVE
jgi:hypothetical protein